jgi:hypothetical protein
MRKDGMEAGVEADGMDMAADGGEGGAVMDGAVMDGAVMDGGGADGTTIRSGSAQGCSAG